MTRFRYDPASCRFRVRNDYSGRYLCDQHDRIMVFRSRWEALQYIKRLSLSQDVYYPEVM